MTNTIASLFDSHGAVIFFDTETTGLKADEHQIIELAAIRVERSGSGLFEELRVTGSMDTFIKLPEGERIPEKIVELTHITDEQLAAEGVDPSVAADKFTRILSGGPIVMAAHNAQFDLLFVRELLRGKHFGPVDFLDTVTVYKDRRAYPHKLANAIAAYKIDDVHNTHRAIDDVEALLAVTVAMGEERDDLSSYLNVFGFNPKYGGPADNEQIHGVTYAAQGFRKTMARPAETLPQIARAGK